MKCDLESTVYDKLWKFFPQRFYWYFFFLKRHYRSFWAKFIKRDFSHGSHYFCWSENNTILMKTITVLSPNLIIFGGLVINIAVTSFLFRCTCAENVNMTSMTNKRRNVRIGRNLTDSARKRLKNPDTQSHYSLFYLGDKYQQWTKKK